MVETASERWSRAQRPQRPVDFVRDIGDPVDALALVSVGDLLRRVDWDRSLTPPALEALHGKRDGGPVLDEGRAFGHSSSFWRPNATACA